MPTNGKSFRIFSFFIFLVIVALVVYLLDIPWENHAMTLLYNYGKISGCFFVIILAAIPFRILTIKQKEIVLKTSNFRLGFGPIIDVAIEPLVHGSVFYAALYILYKVLQEGLSLDPLLILLAVAGILLYQSVDNVIKMIIEIFHVQKAEKPTTI